MSTISAGTTTPTALSLSGDTTGALTFQVNGTTTAATVTSAGNVGIGTTSPAVQVHATGVGRFSQLQLPNNAGTYTSGSAGFHLFGFSDNALYFNWFDNGAIVFRNNGTTERLRITAAGDVGIGTSSPGTKLDVAGNINVGASGNKNYQIATDSNGLFLLDRTNTRYPFKINAGAYDDALVIGSTGNVGIGTAAPGTKLTVSSATNAGISVTDGTVTTILYNTSSANGSVGTTSNHPMAFYTNNAERMRVTAGGLVGIGTTSPNVGLEVASAATENNRSLRVAFDSTYYFEIRNLGAAGARLRSNNGQIVFNITGTDYAELKTSGEFVTGGTTDNGAYNLQCNGTGVWGAGAYVNGSDERLKDNIQSLDSGLDVIKAMRPVTFQYKPEYSKDQSVQPGFIAQELQTAMAGKAYLEGVVQEGPNHLNVAYQNIIPILVKAMQEQQDQIKVLQDKIAALEIR